MFTDETQNPTPSNLPTDEPSAGLYPWQWDSVFNCDQYRFLALCSGRGAGKSYTDTPRIFRWSEMATDLHFGIFAPTDAQLHTVLAPIRKALDEIDIKHVFEKQPPLEWQHQWDAQGIEYPAQRLRNDKVWIWDDATHIFAATVLNNAYTRAKSLDMNAILFQEGTEPGVTENVLTTLIPCLRCGRATKQRDGSYRCVVPGHLHQFVYAFNVPLDPSHFIFKKVEKLKRREKLRASRGLGPYFFLFEIPTSANKAVGENFIEDLEAAFDAGTFIQQTSGKLERNAHALVYHAFTENNILDTLTYDNRRALHMWFDFNNTPAAVGWGHDLRWNEVPISEQKRGRVYHGVIGELFSGNDPMPIDLVCRALLEDPTRNVKDARCSEIECGHPLVRHVEMWDGWHCMVCDWSVMDEGNKRRFCSGRPTTFDEGASGYIHVPSTPERTWRGLALHRGPIYLYGDASGRHSSADSQVKKGGCWKIIRDMFSTLPDGQVHYRVKEANPLISMRLLAVNRGLYAGDHVRSHFFHPCVTAHIDDFREVVPDKDGHPKKEAKPKKLSAGNEYWQRTHVSDAWGYHVDFRWPAVIPKAGFPSTEAMETGYPGANLDYEPRDL